MTVPFEILKSPAHGSFAVVLAHQCEVNDSRNVSIIGEGGCSQSPFTHAQTKKKINK